MYFPFSEKLLPSLLVKNAGFRSIVYITNQSADLFWPYPKIVETHCAQMHCSPALAPFAVAHLGHTTSPQRAHRVPHLLVHSLCRHSAHRIMHPTHTGWAQPMHATEHDLHVKCPQRFRILQNSLQWRCMQISQLKDASPSWPQANELPGLAARSRFSSFLADGSPFGGVLMDDVVVSSTDRSNEGSATTDPNVSSVEQ